MPVILKPGLEKAWLGDVPLDEVSMFLKPYDADLMRAYEVSPAINSVANESLSLIEPVSKLNLFDK
jgi:putative SOS response-associated peptidase YedK